MPRKLVRESFGAAVLEAKDPRRLLVTLLSEGRSVNGFDWTPVMDKVAHLAKGVPVAAYEFSTEKYKQFFDHLHRGIKFLPEELTQFIPRVLPRNVLGCVQEAWVEGAPGKRRVAAMLALDQSATWFGRLAQRMLHLGKAPPAPSLVVPYEDLTCDRRGRVSGLKAIEAFDMVSLPSGGGAIQAAYESITAGGTAMNLWQMLAKFLSEDQMAVLGKAFPEDKRAELTLAGLRESHSTLVDDYLTKMHEASLVPKDPPAVTPPVEPAVTPPKAAATPPPKAVADPPKDPAATPVADPPKGPAPVPVLVPAGAVQESVVITKAEWDRVRGNVDAGLLEQRLGQSKLPDPFKDVVRAQFAGAVFESQALDRVITAQEAAVKKAHERDPIPTISGGFDSQDAVMESFDALWMKDDELAAAEKAAGHKIRRFSGIREAYETMTGDRHCEGLPYYMRKRSQRTVMESINWEDNVFFQAHPRVFMESIETAGFPLILSDRIHKRMARESTQIGLDSWRPMATIERVSDFKAWRIQKFGEYNALSAVAEGGTYPALTTPGEEEVTLQIAKRGGTDIITWESIVNDDTRRFVQLPRKLVKAAMWTLFEDIMNIFENNEAVYDSVALAHADHGPATAGNLGAAALSLTTLEVAILEMRDQLDLSSIRPLGLRPKFLLVPNELEDYAIQLTGGAFHIEQNASGTPESSARLLVNAGSGTAINRIGRYNIQVVGVPHWTDAANWWLVADPMDIEGLVVAFLNGQDTPQLFVQDLPNVGSFFDTEQIIHKVRFIWDRAIQDWRAYYGAVV